MKLSRNWIILLLAFILPMLLLTVAMIIQSNICIFMSLLMWMAALIIVALVPYFKE